MEKNKYFILITFLLAASVFAANRISYTALSDEAEKTGQLNRYFNADKTSRTLQLNGHTLTVEVPQNIRAYDVVPINYTLDQPSSAGVVSISATAFEDSTRTNDQPLYDLNIPGNINVDIEYLGYVRAQYTDFQGYEFLSTNPNTPASPYPPFSSRSLLATSSRIPTSELVWFKFKVTNTGNTILDNEGFGNTFAQPLLYKYDTSGNVEYVWKPINVRIRDFGYIYPGESFEQWVNFYAPELGSQYNLGVIPGEYKVSYRLSGRFYTEYKWYSSNVNDGREFARLDFPLTVEDSPYPRRPETTLVQQDTSSWIPGYFSEFEEFMSSFQIFESTGTAQNHNDTLHLQVAPWTQDIVIKLITESPKDIAVVRIPVNISKENMEINYNPDNIMVVENEDGTESPGFVAQLMPAMRQWHLTPYPETELYELAAEAKELGVNLIANTSGGWYVREILGNTNINLSAASYKHFYDVITKELAMKSIAWSVYPPKKKHWFEMANALTGGNIDYSFKDRYSAGEAEETVDLVGSDTTTAIAEVTKWLHDRWGDQWFTAKDGSVPVDIESTWGWLRDNLNIRYYVGETGRERFRNWALAKYGSLAAINAAWDSNYSTLAEIDPEINQGYEDYNSWVKPVYNNPDHVFQDWNQAVNDWDEFRTILRSEILNGIAANLQSEIPGAAMSVRSEGAHFPATGDGNGNLHMRHIYYGQRRNAMIKDVLLDNNAIQFYSDYTTLPYTNSEWRLAHRDMVQSGIVPYHLGYFNRMKDYIPNPWYGREYQRNYNLPSSQQYCLVNCLKAAYPWWKAAYEEGGAPGILWSDYQVDGYATETQKRELSLLTQNFDAMDKTTADVTDGLVGRWRFDDAPGQYSAEDSTAHDVNIDFWLGDPCELQTNGLIAHYPLDDDPGTGILVDHSGNGYDGGLVGTSNYTGESFVFDGSTHMFAQNIPAQTNTDFTLALWVKGDSAMDGTYGNLIGRSADGTWHDGAKALLLAPDGVWFQNRGYAAVKTTTSLWDDQWHHVAATYDITDNSVKIYIDGVQEAVGTLDLTASPENLSWYYWLSNGSGGHFTGEMKDVRIYDRTLSETDIIALYLNRASGFTGTEFHFANHDAYGYTAEVLPEYATDQSFSWAINIRTKTGGPLISTAYEQIGDGARYLYIDDSNGKVVFAAQDSGATASVVSYTPVNDGQWHNISVTYDDVTDVVRLYVDGMPQGSEIIALKNLQGGNNRPGFGYMGGFGWYTGDMKDIRFYNRVLTENEAFLVYRPRPIRSDFDGDTYVDIEDFNFFVGQWLNDCDTVSMDDCKADFDNNGYVDFADFAVFAAEYLLY